MTSRMRSFTVPVSCSNLVLPCGTGGVASSAAGASDFFGGWLAGAGADALAAGASVFCVASADAAGAAAGVSDWWAKDGRENKLTMAQDKKMRIKKFFKPDSLPLACGDASTLLIHTNKPASSARARFTG